MILRKDLEKVSLSTIVRHVSECVLRTMQSGSFNVVFSWFFNEIIFCHFSRQMNGTQPQNIFTIFSAKYFLRWKLVTFFCLCCKTPDVLIRNVELRHKSLLCESLQKKARIHQCISWYRMLRIKDVFGTSNTYHLHSRKKKRKK